MRQRRKFYFCLLVVIAILSLGIGFAAITDTLVFTGTVKSAGDEELSKNFIVKFQSAKVDYKTEDIDVAEIKISDDNLTVEFNVEGMSSAGSYVTFELVIVNESADLYANGPTLEVYNCASAEIIDKDNPETTDVNEKTPQMDKNDAGQYITSTMYQTNPFYTITITKTSAYDSDQIVPKGENPNGGTQTYQVRIEMTAVPTKQTTDNFTIKFIYEAGSYKSTS